MTLPGCPDCGRELTDANTASHCPSTHRGSCWWERCLHCGALIDGRHPHRHIPYTPRHKETPP